MWTMTTSGFFSAVQHNDDAALLVVRTRDHSDATTLEAWYAGWRGALAAMWGDDTYTDTPEPEVISYEGADYPWRVIMPRTAYGAFMAEQVEDLDYGNFKDAVKAAQGAKRAGVYSGVWSTLLRLEALDPMGRPEPTYEADWDPWERP